MVLSINPANRAPGVHTGPAPWGGGGGGGGSWAKHKKIFFSETTRPAQSFHILFIAIYSVPLYKSCQPCPWDPYGPRHGGVMGKTLKNLLLRNHKAQSFHILCVAQCIMVLFINPAYRAPGVHTGPAPGVSWEKHKKIFFSKTTRPKAFIFCM